MTLTFNSLEEVLAFAGKITIIKKKETEPVIQAEPEVEESPITQPEPEGKEEATYSIEDVRAVIAPLTKAGKKQEVKDLFGSFGATKLSDVKKEDYAALIQKAGEL